MAYLLAIHKSFSLSFVAGSWLFVKTEQFTFLRADFNIRTANDKVIKNSNYSQNV